MTVHSLFATPFYEADLAAPDLLAALATSARSLAADDGAGRRWCRDHHYPGYTSYGSVPDLMVRDPNIAALARALAPHLAAFAAAAHLDLAKRLRIDNIWVNILRPRGGHSGHIHPHSVISGTFYVEIPEGAAALKLEDPRLPLMMAAPPRTADAPEAAQAFVYKAPRPGTVFLWESWLRHEVPAVAAKGERISISFNAK
ncbi:hypothetical protein IP88_13700 [alpha proteobacterium AAP81b]|nr:hypothetical protein IP88_13700 [alpha proteobacterium AAP81b]